MLLFGSNMLGFLAALGVVTFVVEKWLIKSDRKDIAMYVGLVSFGIATVCGLAQYNSAMDAIKLFIDSASF